MAGRDRIIFSMTPYRKALLKIPDKSKLAIFCVNLKMESVLVKGTYSRFGGILPYGLFEIERVYNSMPPQPQYIYPKRIKHEKVSQF